MIGNLIRAAMQQRIAQQNAVKTPQTVMQRSPRQGGFGRLLSGIRDWGSFGLDIGAGTLISPLYGSGILQRSNRSPIPPQGPMGRTFGGYTPGPFGRFEAVNDYLSEANEDAAMEATWGSRMPGLMNTRHLLQRAVQNDLQNQINQNNVPPPTGPTVGGGGLFDGGGATYSRGTSQPFGGYTMGGGFGSRKGFVSIEDIN